MKRFLKDVETEPDDGADAEQDVEPEDNSIFGILSNGKNWFMAHGQWDMENDVMMTS